jgi:hypothetical protein
MAALKQANANVLTINGNSSSIKFALIVIIAIIAGIRVIVLGFSRCMVGDQSDLREVRHGDQQHRKGAAHILK